MPDQVIYHGRREDIRDFLLDLPKILAGTSLRYQEVAYDLKLRLGVCALGLISADFKIKSRGGTGLDGIKWPPLKPATIARRRLGAENKARIREIKKARDFNSAANKKKREALYKNRLSELLLNGLSRAEARKRAAEYADKTIRGEIKKLPTVFQYLSTREVEILVDTSLLQMSLSPGVVNVPSNAEGQVFRVETGAVTVGTREKPWHHFGIPSRRVPARPYWPVDGNIPDAWIMPLLACLRDGLAYWLQRLAAGGIQARRGA